MAHVPAIRRLMLAALAGMGLLLPSTWIVQSTTAHAHGPSALTQHIPTKRLIVNLRAKVAASPDDAKAHYQLARAYVVSAYADKAYILHKSGKYAGRKFKGKPYRYNRARDTWTPLDPDAWGTWDPIMNDDKMGVDLFPRNADDRINWKRICGDKSCNINLRHDKEALRKAASHQLGHAIVHYERALKLNPDILTTLGLAWALDVSGQTERAKKLYRRIIVQTWPSEKDRKWDTMGDGKSQNYGDLFDSHSREFDEYLSGFISYEAGYYLSALLDPSADAAELKDIRAKMVHLAKNGTTNVAVTPIIIPLDRISGLKALVDDSRYVKFNLDGLRPRKWQWVSPLAGLLVFVGDDEHPKITSGHQLFGNVTFWSFWRNGYEAMASLDDNADGWLRGTELDGIAVWHDRNQNGRNDVDEIISLTDLEIVGLAVEPDNADEKSLSHASGVEYSTGQTGPSFDWISHPKPEMVN